MKAKLSPRARRALAAALVLLVALVGYLALISPRRSEAAKLERQIDETQQAIVRASAASRGPGAQAVKAADLFRLAKAMPSRPDMPGLLLELNRIAAEAGLTFESFTPQEPASRTGYQAVPLEVVFEGSFHELSELLYRLRSGVTVADGELHATGRLFAVDRLDFTEGEANFPQIRATLAVNAFVFGGSAPTPGGSAETGATGGDQPSGTSTTPSQTGSPTGGEPAAAGAQAAGSTR